MRRREAGGDSLFGKPQVLPWVGVVWAAKMGLTHYLAQGHFVIPEWSMFKGETLRSPYRCT